MEEPYQTPPEEQQPAGESWQDVGKQFQTLGESLAQTVRAAWESEEAQRRLAEMRDGLESMVREVGRAIDESANSPQGQRIRQEAGRAAGSLRNATEQTVQEVRPQLIQALENLNGELQKLINRMDSQRQPPAGGEAAVEDSGEPQI